MKHKTVSIYGIKPDKNQPYTHDHNVCVMKDGCIVTYIQIERFSRKKYDVNLDNHIEYILESNKELSDSDFELVSANSFVGNSFISKDAGLRFDSTPRKDLSDNLEEAFASYNKTIIPAHNCPHELAHIFANVPFY